MQKSLDDFEEFMLWCSLFNVVREWRTNHYKLDVNCKAILEDNVFKLKCEEHLEDDEACIA